MKNTFPQFGVNGHSRWLASFTAVGAAIMLVACGGGSSQSASTNDIGSTPVATADQVIDIDLLNVPEPLGAELTQPSFHVAPVVLNEPTDVDASGQGTSASMAAKQQAIPTKLQGLSTRGLTLHKLDQARSAPNLAGNTVAPAVTPSVVTTYTPAQIRTAYGMPALPALGAKPTDLQAAQMGAGQTIYIVDAYHNPNVVAELNAFNQKFGLPACTSKVLSATTTLPLAPAAKTGCELVVAYTDTNAKLVSTPPAYQDGWATEIALDVQWAHATAPLARIVLIEASDASLNGMLGGIKVANSMGAGVVSMSFGATENQDYGSVNAVFNGTNMTYLASTGDSGALVAWPSSAANVLAVGGTSLTTAGTARVETAWTGAGGGVSAYVAKPSYQSASTVVGIGSVAKRVVSDVSFNADPNTGQYTAIIPASGGTPQWISAGGTSLSAPQWAGLVASANAVRSLASRPAIGLWQTSLYGDVASTPTRYSSVFKDITTGANGSCTLCKAQTGYDIPTGLGTPNVSSLLDYYGGTGAVAAPVVAATGVSGTVGQALTFKVAAQAPNPVTFSLSGSVPAGMVLNAATGDVSWPKPVLGTYNLVVVAKDTKTNLTGQGTYTVSVALPTAPKVDAANITGIVGTALSFKPVVNAANPVTLSLTGAPSGLTINNTTGLLQWAAPVAGNYAVTLLAKDAKTGLTGQAVLTVQISASGLSIQGSTAKGIVGQVLSGSVTINAPGAASLSVMLSNPPSGIQFSGQATSTGAVLNWKWIPTTAGSFTFKVTVRDSLGRTASTDVTIVVNAK